MSQPPTIDDLLGEWKMVSVGQDGGKAPLFIPWLVKMRMKIEGDQYTKIMGSDIVETGRLSVEPSGEFSTMDEHIQSGDDDGKTHLGIIRWVGKKIEHLQGKIGDDRPAGFPYTSESMVGYAKMKRV